MEECSFTTLLRRKTKEAHSLSDALVMSKFALGLIHDQVWAEGLLVFYEIFKFLEDVMQNSQETNATKFFHPDLLRVSFFESNLESYYGPKWKEMNPPRESVQKYIAHLEKLRDSNPDRILPYIYHLYAGLLAGGRILRKRQKMMVFSKFADIPSISDFDTETASYLKKFLRDTMNDIALEMSDENKNELLEESITVFKLNGELIRSIHSVNSSIFIRAIKFSVYASLIITPIMTAYWYYNYSEE